MPTCPDCNEYLEYLKYNRIIIEAGRIHQYQGHDATMSDTEHEEYMCPFCCCHIADTPEKAQKFLRSD